MPINADQLRTLVIRPVLAELNLTAGEAAENLLMGTAAHESHLGDYLAQTGGGPARGIFQMEPATLLDCYENYLDFPGRAELKKKVDSFLAPGPLIPAGQKNAGQVDRVAQLVSNLAYASAMCRIRYYRVREKMPAADDIEGLANYWKQYYNTPLGAGTVEQFINDYKRFLG